MVEHLNNEIFKQITEVVAKTGQETYVVGGYVRDHFLERPSKDIDIVTLGSGIGLAKGVAKMLIPPPRVTVFKNFGTAQLKYKNFEVEFVSARKESYRHDSRKPDVEPGTLEDDQNRRDFTVNALAIHLAPGKYGELIDPFGGMADLNAGVLRTPLDPVDTFDDDPLRIIRAARFSAQLGF